jgi:hypothetical protein
MSIGFGRLNFMKLLRTKNITTLTAARTMKGPQLLKK